MFTTDGCTPHIDFKFAFHYRWCTHFRSLQMVKRPGTPRTSVFWTSPLTVFGRPFEAARTASALGTAGAPDKFFRAHWEKDRVLEPQTLQIGTQIGRNV